MGPQQSPFCVLDVFAATRNRCRCGPTSAVSELIEQLPPLVDEAPRIAQPGTGALQRQALASNVAD
jgi:hypothetical protein